MSEQGWAKEPWKIVDYDEIEDANGVPILEDVGLREGWSYDGDNTPRIVACVNACAGVPMEELEQFANLRRVPENMGIPYEVNLSIILKPNPDPTGQE